MKKVLIFICSLFCLFTLVGCHSVSELTKANDELKEGNYTVYYQTQKNAVYKKKTITNESAEYLVKQNGNQKTQCNLSQTQPCTAADSGGAGDHPLRFGRFAFRRLR